MKKILAKKNNRTGIKNHRSNKNKFHRSYKAYQIMTVSRNRVHLESLNMMRMGK